MALSGIQAMQSRIAAIESTFAQLNRVTPQPKSSVQVPMSPTTPTAKSATKVSQAALIANQSTKTAPAADFAKVLGRVSAPAAIATQKWPQVSPLVNRWQNTMKVAGAQYGVDPALLAAVAQVESGGNPAAKSPAGALGLMQFMPGTAKELGVDPMNPTSAINGAAKLLRGHLDKFGSLDKALAAYNAGPGAVSRFGGVPPYPETQGYVQKVSALLKAAA